MQVVLSSPTPSDAISTHQGHQVKSSSCTPFVGSIDLSRYVPPHYTPPAHCRVSWFTIDFSQNRLWRSRVSNYAQHRQANITGDSHRCTFSLLNLFSTVNVIWN